MKSLFEGLPSLHPLLVHFPIVLLLTALISHIGALLFKKHRRPFTVLTFGLLLLGTLGAFAAIQTANHISGDADEGAFAVFEIHQRFAWISFWLARHNGPAFCWIAERYRCLDKLFDIDFVDKFIGDTICHRTSRG
jgi:uncharacterized membrane protein